MAWCRQATSHYLSQWWPRSLWPYGVTRPQWFKCNSTGNAHVSNDQNTFEIYTFKIKTTSPRRQWVNSLGPSDAYMRQETNHHWFRQWLVAWSVSSHYLNQCLNIVNSNLRNKLQWNLKQNSYIFVQENAFEKVVYEMAATLSRPQCAKMWCPMPHNILLFLLKNISNETSLLWFASDVMSISVQGAMFIIAPPIIKVYQCQRNWVEPLSCESRSSLTLMITEKKNNISSVAISLSPSWCEIMGDDCTLY